MKEHGNTEGILLAAVIIFAYWGVHKTGPSGDGPPEQTPVVEKKSGQPEFTMPPLPPEILPRKAAMSALATSAAPPAPKPRRILLQWDNRDWGTNLNGFYETVVEINENWQGWRPAAVLPYTVHGEHQLTNRGEVVTARVYNRIKK